MMETEIQTKNEKRTFRTHAASESISSLHLSNNRIGQQNAGQQTGTCSGKMRVLFSGNGKAERDMGLAPIPALRPFELRMPYN